MVEKVKPNREVEEERRMGRDEGASERCKGQKEKST